MAAKMKVPEIVAWYYETISPVLAGLQGTIDRDDELELKFRFYGEKMYSVRDDFMAMIKSKIKDKEEGPIDLLRCLRVYGIDNVRLLVFAQKLSDLSKTKSFYWNEKTKLPVMEPSKYLTYASKILSAFEEIPQYKMLGFLNGVVFDFLGLLADQKGSRKGALRKFIEACLLENIKKTNLGYEKAKKASDLKLGPHLVTFNLMKDAGKILMAIFFDDYLENFNNLKKKSVPAIIRNVYEKDKYGISSYTMGSLLCQGLSDLSPASVAVLFAHAPFLQKNCPEDHHTLRLSLFASGEE